MEIIISTTINLILRGTYDVSIIPLLVRQAPGRAGPQYRPQKLSDALLFVCQLTKLHIDKQIIKYIKYIFILYLIKYISHCRNLKTKRLETLNLDP